MSVFGRFVFLGGEPAAQPVTCPLLDPSVATFFWIRGATWCVDRLPSVPEADVQHPGDTGNTLEIEWPEWSIETGPIGEV